MYEYLFRLKVRAPQHKHVAEENGAIMYKESMHNADSSNQV